MSYAVSTWRFRWTFLLFPFLFFSSICIFHSWEWHDMSLGEFRFYIMLHEKTTHSTTAYFLNSIDNIQGNTNKSVINDLFSRYPALLFPLPFPLILVHHHCSWTTTGRIKDFLLLPYDFSVSCSFCHGPKPLDVGRIENLPPRFHLWGFWDFWSHGWM